MQGSPIQRCDWYENPSVYLQLHKYHDRYACQPNLGRVRRIHVHIVNQIRSRLLQEHLCKRVEYSGSAHNDVQIGPHIEFDVLLVMDGGGLSVVTSPYPDNFYLKAYKRFLWGIDDKYKPYMDENEENMIVPQRVVDSFYDVINTILNNMQLNYNMRLVRRGSSVQLVAQEYGLDIYSANFIPCFEEHESWVTDRKRQFIPRLIRGRFHFAKQNFVWRQCFANEENEFFRKIQKGPIDDCRKKLLRILTAIRNTQTIVRYISSYHFKAALFLLSQNTDTQRHWKENNLVLRLMDVLKYIEDCLATGKMPHPILGSDVNIMEHISSEFLNRIRLAIRRMRICENAFKTVISVKWDTKSLSMTTDDVMRHDASICSACLQAEKELTQSSCVIQ